MGTACSSCFKGDDTVIVQPDLVCKNKDILNQFFFRLICWNFSTCFNFLCFQAARRQMQVEAAERRRQESDSRGIKNPEKVSRLQQRAERIEKEELEAAKRGGPVLKVRI